MVVGTLRMELHLPASHSLKAKRSVVNHVKERLRTRFNASVAEVDNQDLWQRATLGVAKIWVSGTISREDEPHVLQALGRAAPYFRSLLAPRLKLRIVPALHFQVDHSIEAGARIDQLLREIQEPRDE